MPENFEIANMWVWWFLPLPFLIYWILPALRFRSTSLNFPNFAKAQAYTGQMARSSALVKKRSFLNWLSIIIVWVSVLAALSSPQLTGEPELKIKNSRNFLVLADISFSMANRDWEIDGRKVRRWDAVKAVMHDFVSKRQGDRMGLIFFGSSAYIQVPFTPDLVTFEQMLEESDVGMAGQMTNIGKAIVKGINMFENDTIDTKIMLLLTDGVDAGTGILPLDAAEMAKTDSIIIYTIGIGNPANTDSDLDETTLIQIAELTGGKYFRAIDTEKLEGIYAELDKLEPIEYEEENYKPRTLLYYYPLGAAIAVTVLMILMYSINGLISKKE